jgi:uncharacterized membrane protein
MLSNSNITFNLIKTIFTLNLIQTVASWYSSGGWYSGGYSGGYTGWYSGGYSNYGYSNYGYSNYGYSNYGYSNYGYSRYYGYSNYGSTGGNWWGSFGNDVSIATVSYVALPFALTALAY